MADSAGSWSIEKNGTTYTYKYTVEGGSAVTVTGLSLGAGLSTTGSYNGDDEPIVSLIYLDQNFSTSGIVHVDASLLLVNGTASVSGTGTTPTSYRLVIDDDDSLVTDANEVKTEYSWDVKGTSATYYTNKRNYFEASGASITYHTNTRKAVAAITSLSGLADTDKGKTDIENVTGITVNKTSGAITLTTNVIGNSTTEVEDLDGSDNIAYKVTKISQNSTDGTIFGLESTKDWSVNTGTKTANYVDTVTAGWEVISTGAPSGITSKVTYAGMSTHTLMSVKGIATTAQATDFYVPDQGAQVVTLQDRAIGSESIYLTAINAGYSSYSLQFANAHNAITGASYLEDLGSVTGGGISVAYRQDTSDSFTVSGQSALYSASSTHEFFQISGVSSTVGIAVDDNTGTITLSQSALRAGGVSITFDDKGGKNYSLSLATGVKSVTDLDPYWTSTSSGDSSTFTYQYLKSDGWSVAGTSNTEIRYTASLESSSAISLFTLTGLSKVNNIPAVANETLHSGITVNPAGVSDGTYTVTLDRSVLTTGDVNLNDSNGSSDGKTYNLALADAANLSVKASGYNYFSAQADGNSTKFTYQYHNLAGWSVVGTSTIHYTAQGPSVSLFTLEGLSAGLSIAGGTSTTFDGITVGSESNGTVTVTLSQKVLGASTANYTVKINDEKNDDSIGYSLSLAADVGRYNTIDNEMYHWETVTGGGTSTTATFLYRSQAGFQEAVGTSAAYKISEDHPYFTITGLKTGLSAANLTAAFNTSLSSAATHTLELTRDVLGGYSVYLTDNDNDSKTIYKLEIDKDASIGSISNAKKATQAVDGKVLITADVLNYYATVSGSESQINYVASDNQTVASISGIKVKASNNTTQGVTVGADGTITLDEKAFAKKDISFVTNFKNASDSAYFKFAFANGGTSLHEYATAGWSIVTPTGATSATATYQQDIIEGYTLATGGSAVGYSGATASTAVYMTLTGLNSTVTSAAIDIDTNGNVVTLKDAALGTSSISITGISYSDYGLTRNYTGYKLAFENDHSTVKGTEYFTAATGTNGISVAYRQDTSAGFTFNYEQTTATYSGSSTETFFTIDGLSTAISTVASARNIAGVALNGTVITLDKTVLTNKDVTLDGEGYSLALASNVQEVETLPSYWTSTTGGNSAKFTYQFDTSQGWAVESASKVKYTAASTSATTLFTIEGLNKPASDLTKENNVTEYAGLSVVAGNSVVTIGAAVLGSSTAAYTIEFTDAEGGLDYIPTLAAGISDTLKGDNYFSASAVEAAGGAQSSATATYQYDVSEGWKLNGTTINYTASAPNQQLFEITGLSYGLTAEQMTAGITVTATGESAFLVTVDKSVLGSQSIKLVDKDGDDYTFSLSLASNVVGYSSINTAGIHWEIENAPGGGISATLLYNPQPGFTQSGDSAATYTEGATVKYLTLTGLSAGLSAADLSSAINVGLSTGTNTITLDRNVLGAFDVNLKDENDSVNGSDDNINFKLALTDSATLGSFENPTTVVSSDDVEIQADLKNYYTLDSDTKIIYTGESAAHLLAKISGLSIVGETGSEEVEGMDFTGSVSTGFTITLGASAFKRSDVSLTDNYNGYFSLALNDGDKAANGNILDYHDPELVFTEGTGGTSTATYQRDISLGYKLMGNSSISYFADTINTEPFLTITGLSTGADATNITVDGGESTVILGNDAIGTTNIALTANATAYNAYTLAFKNPENYTREESNNYWTTDGANTYSYRQDTSAGFSFADDNKTANYSDLTTETFFTISGLSAGLTNDQSTITDNEGKFGSLDGKFTDITGVTVDEDKVITLGLEALDGKDVSLDAAAITAGYKFDFDVDHGPQPYDDNIGYNGMYFAEGSTSGTFILKYNTTAGYSLAANSTAVQFINVVENSVATISGLNQNITVGSGESFGKLGTMSNGEFTAIELSPEQYTDLESGTDELTFQLTDKLLGASTVYLTSDKYVLEISDLTVDEPTDDSSLYWAVDADDTTKVNYQFDTSEGYTLSDDQKTFAYSPSKSTPVLTIAGLATTVIQGINAVDPNPDDIEDLGVAIDGTDETVTLSLSALGTTAVSLTADGDDYKNYKFVLNDEEGGGSVPTKAGDSTTWTVTKTATDATAVFRKLATEYYTLASNGKTVTYTEPKTGNAIATITGLSTGVNTSLFTVEAYQPAIKDTDPDTEGDQPKEEVVGTITLDATAMNGKNISLAINDSTVKYNLALSSAISAPTLTNAAWIVTGTTATYAAKVTNAGYAVAPDGQSVKYTAAGNSAVTLVTLNGLKSGAEVSNLSVSGTEITIAQSALNTNNVVIKGANDMGYTLKPADETVTDDDQSTYNGHYTKPHKATVWRVNGTTATYKKVTLAYYETDATTGNIIYHAEEDVKDGTLITITGLSSGLLTDDKGNIYLGTDESKTNVFTVAEPTTVEGTTTPGKITVNNANAFSTKTDAEITSGNYEFVIDAVLPTKTGTDTWTLTDVAASGTTPASKTASYRANFNAGYDFATTTKNKEIITNTKKVEYVKAATGKEIAQITGLNADVVIGTGTDAGKLGYKDSNGAFQEGITYNEGTKVFTINNDKMLGTTDAKVTDSYKSVISGHTLKLDAAVTEENDAAITQKWAITSASSASSATADYANYKPAFYTLGGDSTTVTYTAEAKQDVLTTISGLNKDLIVSDNCELGTNTGTEGAFVKGATINTMAGMVTLEKDVLGAFGVEAANNYTLKLNGVDTSAKDLYKLTDYASNLVTLKKGTDEYYTVSGSSAAYHAATADSALSEVTKVTGIKNGLTVDDLELKDGDTVVATFTPGNSTVTLKAGALNGQDVTVNGNYKISIDTTDIAAPGRGTTWTKETDGTFTYSNCTTAGYTLSQDGKTLTYSPQAPTGDPLVKISGLNKDLIISNDGKLGYKDSNGEFKEAVTIDNNVVTIKDAKAFAKSDIYVAESTDEYTFDISNVDTNDSGKYIEDAASSTWALTKKGTATYTRTTEASYAFDTSDSKSIVYTEPITTVSTLTGLNDKVELVTDENDNSNGKLGIKKSASDIAADGTTGTTTSNYTEVIAVTDYTLLDVTNQSNAITAGEFKVLVEGALTTKNLTLSTKKDNKPNNDYYKLALKTDASTNFLSDADITPHFTKAKNSDTATYGTTIAANSYTVNTDGTTITYHKSAEKTTLATIKGLNKDVALDENGQYTVTGGVSYGIETIDTSEKDATGNVTKAGIGFAIHGAVLNDPTASTTKDNSKVTLTIDKKASINGGDAYANASLSLASDVDLQVNTGAYWLAPAKKGTATYQFTTDAGYTRTNASTITYNKDKDKVLFTLNGLNKAENSIGDAFTAKPTATSTTQLPTKNNNQVISGFDFSEDDNKNVTVTLTNSSLLAGSGSVKLTAGKKDILEEYGVKSYALAVGQEIAPAKTTDPVWTLSGTTGTLVSGTTAGYTYNNKNGTATFQKANLNTKVATVKGLAKGLKVNSDNQIGTNVTQNSTTTFVQGITYDDVTNTITLKNNVLGATNVTVDNATFALSGVSAPTKTLSWAIDTKGTATYSRSVDTAGYELSDDHKTVTYTASTKTTKNGTTTDKPTTLITITGLKKDGSITASGGKLYTGATTGATTGTTTGTGDTTNATTGTESVVLDDDNIVTLNAAVLNKTKVAIKSGDKNTKYTLAFADDVATSATDATFWSVSGTKASYVDGKTEYYKLDTNKTSATYYKPTTSKTYVTLSGIRKDTDASNIRINTSNNVITLNTAALPEVPTAANKVLKNGTSVTLANGKNVTTNYTFELDNDVTKVAYAANSSFTKSKSGKTTLSKQVTSSGFEVSSDSKKITYVEKTAANAKPTVLATVSGIANDVTLTANDQTKVVSLSADALKNVKKNITITSTEGYHFDKIDAAVTAAAPTIASGATVTLKSGTATFTGKSSAGFLYSDPNTINYVAAIGTSVKAAAMATVKGLLKTKTEANSTLDAANRTITVATSDIDTTANKPTVTVDGKGLIGFTFGEEFDGTASKAYSIVGGSKDDTLTVGGDYLSISSGAGNDVISVTGNNVTVNAGKGNDRIDLGNGTGQKFIYASGDGNDTLTGFTSTTASNTTFSITKAKSVTFALDGDDVIATVDKNTLTFTDYAKSVTTGTEFEIKLTGTNYSSKFTKPAPNGVIGGDVAASADMLYDNNYVTGGAQLGDIVNGSDSGLLAGDWSNPSDATSLTQQTPTATYGSKK